jgi:hypothetical protein
MERRAQRTGISLYGGPLGEPGRGACLPGTCKALEMGISIGALLGCMWEGLPFTGNSE